MALGCSYLGRCGGSADSPAALSPAPSAPAAALCPALFPGSQAPSPAAAQPVPRCSDRPGLTGSAVIRWCLKGGRSAPCSRSPSATSVPLGRDSFGPGAIRSQAEGGMPLSSKSQSGQRGKTPPYTRVYGTACAPARPTPAKRVQVWHQFSNKSQQFLMN